MVDNPVVAVRGEAVREVPPELARFTVTAEVRDKDRPAALARLTERLAAVRAVLDSYAEAIERRETGGVVVAPERRGRGERVSAYHGSVATNVTVTDFTLLGDLMLRLADLEQTSVNGPWWELRRDSPVYREARRAAITDAFGRARDYAAAIGVRLVRLLELTDAGLAGQPIPLGGGLRMMAAQSGGPEHWELDLEPQVQAVHAQVEARFEISEADLDLMGGGRPAEPVP